MFAVAILTACGSVQGPPSDAALDQDSPLEAGCVPPPAGMVSWWPGEDSGLDVAGTNDASLMGASFAPGKVGRAFLFGGTDELVRAPDSATLDIVDQLTIETWVFPDPVGSARIVDKVTGGTSDGYLFDTIGGKLRFGVSAGGSMSNAEIASGAWTHVAGVYDGVNVRLYIDGVGETPTPATGSISTNAFPLTIGANHETSAGDLWSGEIDELAIYNRGLSATEIAAIFEAGADGKCKP